MHSAASIVTAFALVITQLLTGVFSFESLVAYAVDSSLVVDQTIDDAGAGACDDAIPADCSFRSAVTVANLQGPVTNSIDLTGVSGTITLGSALPNFTAYTTVTGPGSGSLTINFNSFSGITFAGAYERITDVTLTGASASCIDFDSGGNAGTHSWIKNSVVNNCGQFGVSITPFGSPVSYVDIQNNTISNTQSEGIMLATGNSQNISDINISGNTISDIGMSGTESTINTIDLWDDDAGYTISNVTIDSNDLTGRLTGTVVAIQTNGANIDVTNNTNITGGKHGVLMNAVSTGSSISGNSIHDLSAVNGTAASLQSGATGSTISGNTINAAYGGAVISGATSTTNTISTNTITNVTYGVYLADSNSNTISGNTVTAPIAGGMLFLNSDSNTSSGNTITGSVAGTGIQLGGSTNPAYACTGNTFTSETLTGNLYGFSIGDSSGTTNNTLSDSAITTSGSYDLYHISPGADTLDIVDTTFTTYDVTSLGIIDVTFNPNVRATYNGYGITDATVTATQVETSTATSLGTTNAGGYATAAVTYSLTSASTLTTPNSYSFAGTSPTQGAATVAATTLSLTNLNLAMTNFDSSEFVDGFYASYSPLRLTATATNYNDKLVYVWDVTDASAQATVSADYTFISGADGIDNGNGDPTDGWDYALISITGGAHSGEKWTVVTRQDMFPAAVNLQTWLNDAGVSGVGVGNYAPLDMNNSWYGVSDATIMAQGSVTDYSYSIPGTTTVVAGATSPGFLNYSNSNFKASKTTLTVDGVDYDTGLVYVGNSEDPGYTMVNANDRIGVANGISGFDFVLMNITGLGRYTLLFRTDNFANLASVNTWGNAQFGPGVYTVDYYTLNGGTADVAVNGFTNNYSFTIPGFGTTVSVTTGTADPGYLTYGNGPERTIALSTSAASIAESAGTATVTATLSGVETKNVTVPLSFAGTATNVTDYTRSTASITITAGSTTGTAVITGVHNGAYSDTNKTVVVTAGTIINAAQNSDTITVTILEADNPVQNSDTYDEVVHQYTQCNDSIDNDNDGFIDFGTGPNNDPGCSSSSDNSESNVTAPTYQCNDGIDNDVDGLIDYGTDANNDCGCSASTDDNEDTACAVVPVDEIITDDVVDDVIDDVVEDVVPPTHDPDVVQDTINNAINTVTDGTADVTQDVIQDVGQVTKQLYSAPPENPIAKAVISYGNSPFMSMISFTSIDTGVGAPSAPRSGGYVYSAPYIARVLKEGPVTFTQQKALEKDVVETVTKGITDGIAAQNNVTLCDETGCKEVTDTKNLEIIVGILYSDEELAAAKKEALDSGKTPVIIDENSDVCGSYVSDMFTLLSGKGEICNQDPDKDEISTRDEIYMGTDPMTPNKEMPIACLNVNGETLGASPSFRCVGNPGDTLEVILVPAKNYRGVNDENIQQMSLGKSFVGTDRKAEFTTQYKLSDGNYYLIPKADAKFGTVSKFTVSKAVDKEVVSPEFIDLKSTPINKKISAYTTKDGYCGVALGATTKYVLDVQTEINANGGFSTTKYAAERLPDSCSATLGSFITFVLEIDQNIFKNAGFNSSEFIAASTPKGDKVYTIKGKSTPLSPVYISMKSVVFSSVVLADAKGNFELKVYDKDFDVAGGDHSLIGYSADTTGKKMSSAKQSKISKASLAK